MDDSKFYGHKVDYRYFDELLGEEVCVLKMDHCHSDELLEEEMAQSDRFALAPIRSKGRSDSIKSKKAAERRKNVRKAQKKARKCK